MEAPLIPMHGNVAAARKLMCLAGHTEFVALRRDVRCEEVSVQTVRKHFCGYGRAKKPDVQEQCRRLGWAYADDNAADALAVWAYVEACKAPRTAQRRLWGGLCA
jgi:Holliday junction resolvasome RuvABC endonuclease subunit